MPVRYVFHTKNESLVVGFPRVKYEVNEGPQSSNESYAIVYCLDKLGMRLCQRVVEVGRLHFATPLESFRQRRKFWAVGHVGTAKSFQELRRPGGEGRARAQPAGSSYNWRSAAGHGNDLSGS